MEHRLSFAAPLDSWPTVLTEEVSSDCFQVTSFSALSSPALKKPTVMLPALQTRRNAVQHMPHLLE